MRCSSVQGPHNEDENPHMTTWLHVRTHLVAGHNKSSGSLPRHDQDEQPPHYMRASNE